MESIACCRCYAASAEASLWQASFPQLLQVSTAFGFAAPAPLVREAGLLPPTCYDKIVVTPLEPEGIVIDCASVAIKDGSLCVSNQLKGTCQSSVCVTVPTGFALSSSHEQHVMTVKDG